MGCCKSKGGVKRLSIISNKAASEVESALTELVETEQNYGKDLKILTSSYLDPLRSESLFFDQTALIAFNSITLDLAERQGKFQAALEKAMENMNDKDVYISSVICKAADVFVSLEPDFEIYNKYIICMTRVQAIINRNKGIAKVVNFVEEKFKQIDKTLGNEEISKSNQGQGGKMMTMESLIMKPFQRVMLYPLILERIEKQCGKGTVDKEKIQKVIQIIKTVGTKMNDAMKQDEQSGYGFQKLLDEYGVLEYAKQKASHT